MSSYHKPKPPNDPRPGNMMSVMGLILGLVMLAIVIFYVIPKIGQTGYIYAAAALLICAMNVFTIINSSRNTRKIKKNPADELAERLRRLDELREQGVITQQEYEEKRREILREI